MVDDRIDLNAAPAQELTGLPGIGSVLAQRIVAYRDTVHPYEDPSEIMEVSGIGEKRYRAIADRLAVRSSPATPAVLSQASNQESVSSQLQSGEDESPPGGKSVVKGEEETARPEIKAVPPGESLSPEGLPLHTAAEEEVNEPTPEQGVVVEAAEGLEREPEAPAREEDEESSQTMKTVVAGDAKETAEDELFSPLLASPAVATTRPSWWRRLSWLWTAILGGLLGMVFALIVFAGLNGSLDVGHSRAVLGLQGDVRSLQSDLASLDTDVEGLQGKLDTLEGLTTRVEDVEANMTGLREEAAEFNQRADALEEEVIVVSEDLKATSERMDTLQRLVERTDGFFSQLQMLLADVFGELDQAVTPTPPADER